MVRRIETDPIDRDERLGEAIEAYLALAEDGRAPDAAEFVTRYPDLGDDLREALEGLALVQGLVGDSNGSGHGLESGRRIAGYRIVRELGRGGMGVVYEAVHVGLDRPVALKVLGTHAAPDSNGRRRFLNEARTAAGLHHTHIVPVFDVGQVGGLCYYAMQRIEGAGLDRVLSHLRRDRSIAAGSSQGATSTTGPRPSLFPGAISSGWWARGLRRSRAPLASAGPGSALPLPVPGLVDETVSWHSRGDGRAAGVGLGIAPREPDDDLPPPFVPPRGTAYYRWVAEIGRQASEALAHAHRRGIVHRDVKPSNLLVDARGVVWVADFGLARRLADPSQTQQDSLLGTPRYMSPEQARIGPIDGRSDIYSLGATLYELLTLRPPFDGRTAAELVAQIGEREPIAPREFDKRLSRDFETILLKALAKRPEDRYVTATELAEDLKRFLNHEPVHARRISPVGRLWRFARRRPSLAIVSATAAATVLVVATVAYVKVMKERDQVRQAWVAEKAATRKNETTMRNLEAANRATQAAMREMLWRQASLVRLTNLPNRRVRGLGLLKEAAALAPDPALLARLRNEAVGFLMLRDVEARPGFASGPTRGLVFAADGTRLAAVQDNGEEMSLWDVERRQLMARPRLRAAGPPNQEAPGAGAVPGRGGRGPWVSNRIVSVDRGLVTILPNNRGLRLFDAVTGDFVRDLKTLDRQFVALFAAPGGNRLVTIERSTPAVAQAVGRDGDPGRRPDPAPGPVPVPEGGARSEYLVNLWDPGRWAPESVGQPIATLARWEIPKGPSFPPLVAISPDGAIVATAQWRTSAVAFWSADDGEPRGATETTGDLSALALGPDGLMATAGGGKIRLWDVGSDAPKGQITPHQSYIRHLRFHPRGTLLAAAGSGTEVELWDPSSHVLVAVLPAAEADRSEPQGQGQGRGVEDLAFSPDGRILVASGHGATAPAWAIVDPVAQVRLDGFDSLPVALAFRDGGLLGIGSSKGAIWFWQADRCASTLQQARVGVATGPAAGWRTTALTFDDRGRLLVLDPDGLRCWDQPPLDTEAARIPLPPLPASGPGGGAFNRASVALARAADGRTVFVARQSQVLAWHSSEPDRLRPLILPGLPEPRDPERDGRHHGPTSWQAIAAAPDGSRLYLIDQGNRVHVLAIEGEQARWLDWSSRHRATALAVSPDGNTVALGDRSGNVTLVDAARGIETAQLRPPANEGERQVSSIVFAPGGRELAVGTQKGLVDVWSLDRPSAPQVSLSGHRSGVQALAFDPGGKHLASAGSDRTVEVWDLAAIRDELGRLGLAW